MRLSATGLVASALGWLIGVAIAGAFGGTLWFAAIAGSGVLVALALADDVGRQKANLKMHTATPASEDIAALNANVAPEGRRRLAMAV